MRVVKVLFLVLTTSITVFGQTERKGLLFGAGIGASNIVLNFPSKSLNQFGPAINWKVGYSISPKTSLLLNGAISIYDFDLSGRPRKRDFSGVMPSVQHWIGKKTWLLAGIGIGTDAPVFYDLETDNEEELKYYAGLGTVAAVGYEIFKKKNLVIDLQARINYSSVELPIGRMQGLSSGLFLGVNFY